MTTRHVGLLAIIGLFFLLIPQSYAQACGPGCPDCSGGGAEGVLPEHSIVLSALLIPDGDAETAVYNAAVAPFSWLTVGLGYAVEAEEVIWSIRTRAIPEDSDGWRPMVALGTGSVQAGGSDQSAYLQVGKTQDLSSNLSLSVMGGYATDIPDADEDYGLAPVMFTIANRISPFYLYDGVASHGGLRIQVRKWLELTGYALEMDTFGVAVALKWGGPAASRTEGVGLLDQ
jgi:hypothetical protein